MTEYVIRQGDQYAISFPIILDRHIVTDDLVDKTTPARSGDVEIVVGNLRKTFAKGQVKFNDLTYTFDFPLLQAETFAWRPGMRLKSQVRVKLRKFDDNEDNFICSYDGPDVVVVASMSKESI